MFDKFMSILNGRKPFNSWHSQLLENESSIKKMTMAELFLKKCGQTKKAVRVPAECIEMTTSHSTFSFKDSSVATLPNSLIC